MKITIVTTMRNEGPHLLEWIAHNRAAGVTDFLVFTNACEDGTDAMLDLLQDAGIVSHIRQHDGGKPPQWRALKAAWDHPLVVGADWVACLDCDEFINLKTPIKTLAELIEMAQADAILLQWRLFGHNGQLEISDKPTTQRFTRAAPAGMLYPPIGSYFKTLFRRAGPFRQFGVHRPRQKNSERHGLPRWIDGSGVGIEGSLARNDAQIMNWGGKAENDLVELNHYSVRSAAEFMVKRARGLPNHQSKPIDLGYWIERNFNIVEERSIQNMGAATQEELNRLMEIKGIKQAQQAAINWYKDKFDTLMADDEELRLYGRLVLSDGSIPPDRATAMELIRKYQAIHQND